MMIDLRIWNLNKWKQIWNCWELM